MRKITIYGLLCLVLTTFSCRGRKHDVAYYEMMIDSIRKAEQVAEIQKQAGIYTDPVEAFFDTIQRRSLPIQSAGADVGRIGRFSSVPPNINEHFGYPANARLKALALPKAWRRPVILVCDEQDSINPVLSLYIMDQNRQPLDMLCIYQKQNEDKVDDFGTTFMEYFITSKYEITLIQYYQSHEPSLKPQLEHARRFTISKEGLFEELPIEL